MTWADENPEASIAIAGLVFGFIGYWFRSWRESRQMLKEGLYLLSEIWFRTTVALSTPIGKILDSYFERVEARFPEVQFTDEDKQAIKNQATPILESVVRSQGLEGIESLYSAYDRAIALVARSSPIFSYDLAAASTIKARLASVDQYLQLMMNPSPEQDYDQILAQLTVGFLLKDVFHDLATAELEAHVRRLSRKVGPITWLKMARRINRRKRSLEDGAIGKQVDELLDAIIIPAIEASNMALQPTGPGKGGPGG